MDRLLLGAQGNEKKIDANIKDASGEYVDLAHSHLFSVLASILQDNDQFVQDGVDLAIFCSSTLCAKT